MLTNHRFLFIAMSCVALGHGAQAAPEDNAGSYPAKPIRLVVATAPGGGVDTLARLVAQKLVETWSQQVVVDNRGGASGIIATELVAKSPADGYTLLMAPATFAINPALFPKLPYDPVHDFIAVAQFAAEPNVLVVHPSVPAKSVQELIAVARAQPGRLNYGAGSVGSSSHVSGELFKMMTGIRMTAITYKSMGPAVNALVGGEVSLMFSGLPPVLPMIKANRLNALGVTSLQRSAFLPAVPTIAESGVPGYEVTNWIGMFAPAGTAPAVVAKLDANIARVLRSPDMKERFAAYGVEPAMSASREFSAFVDAEIGKWAKVITASHTRVE